MSLNFDMPEFKEWVESWPLLTGVAETDVTVLGCYWATGSALLKALGPKPGRSSEQLKIATLIQDSCRSLRRQFMALHADWLYKSLTKGLTLRKRLDELAFEAAELCPGLVPSSSQIAEERTHLQADKEGFEIDQGLFFHALLGSPQAGTHLIESAQQPTDRALSLIESFQANGQLDVGTVHIQRRGSAAHLTMNNGHCMNAEDNQLVDDMETAVDLALLHRGIHVGVLRGGTMTHPRHVGRRVFSAGINLKALHAGQISFVDFLLRREIGYMNKIFRGLRLDQEAGEGFKKQPSIKRIEKPWIAVVESFAIGGGAQMLLIFDRVIAASDSYFSLPAAHEGIVPGFSNLRLTRFLGGRKSRQVILGGRQIWAHEADAQLLIDEVVSANDLDVAIERSIQDLDSPAVVANRHMLNLAEEPLSLFLQYAAEFALVQSERLYSEDVVLKSLNSSQRSTIRASC